VSKLKGMIKLIGRCLIFLFSHFVPKNKKLWVFGAWFGMRYSDNPKIFFEYINKNEKSITTVWIAKDKNIVKHIRHLGFNAYYHKSILGLWYQTRAQFAFVCQALQDDLYSPGISSKTKVINLWHGFPIKKIMYDILDERVCIKNNIGKLADFLSPYNKDRNDYLIATNELTQRYFSKAFKIPKENILITGFPRNDVFYEKMNSSDNCYKCIYMPTLRGWKGDECDLFLQYGFDFDKIDKKLREHNIQLYLRMHPVNSPPEAIVELIKKTNNIFIDSSEDIYSSINNFDCLVTDYSSIYFDYLLSNKPVVFAPFDLDIYLKNEKSLYFEYSDIALEPLATNWLDVISRLIELKNEGVSKEYASQYQKMKNHFHKKNPKEESPFSKLLFEELKKI